MPTPKDNAKENTARIEQQRKDVLASIRRTFDTPDGKRTLAWLHASAATGEPAFKASRDGNYCPIAAAFRNGRQSVILEIAENIAQAEALGV